MAASSAPLRRALRRALRRTLLSSALATALLVVAAPGPYTCTPIPVEPADCPTHVVGAVDCPYRLVVDGCPAARCQERCASDADCLVHAEYGSGPHCVAGNCVHCWQDTQCGEGELCRGGRCVAAVAEPAGCPAPGSCDPERCRVVSVSEEPCPVCVCDSVFSRACSDDYGCQLISSHRYRACTYGRCVDCRNDDDCTDGLTCMPPGLCFVAEPDPSRLYGTWLVGWPGGLDHFSYVRFEPDGTFRRGRYEPEGAFADDMFLISCDSDAWPPSAPQLGTWEVEMTQSLRLAVHIRPNGDCWLAGEVPFGARYQVQLSDDGRWLTLTGIDRQGELIGARVPAERCTPDMASCAPPHWEDVYEYPWGP